MVCNMSPAAAMPTRTTVCTSLEFDALPAEPSGVDLRRDTFWPCRTKTFHSQVCFKCSLTVMLAQLVERQAGSMQVFDARMGSAFFA